MTKKGEREKNPLGTAPQPPSAGMSTPAEVTNDKLGNLQKTLTFIIACVTVVGTIISATWYVWSRVNQIESRIEKIELGLKELNQKLSAEQVDFKLILPGSWEVRFDRGDKGMLNFTAVEDNHFEVHGRQEHPNKNIILFGTGEIKGQVVRINYTVSDDSKQLYSGKSELHPHGATLLSGWVSNNNQPKNIELVTFIKRP